MAARLCAALLPGVACAPADRRVAGSRRGGDDEDDDEKRRRVGTPADDLELEEDLDEEEDLDIDQSDEEEGDEQDLEDDEDDEEEVEDDAALGKTETPKQARLRERALASYEDVVFQRGQSNRKDLELEFADSYKRRTTTLPLGRDRRLDEEEQRGRVERANTLRKLFFASEEGDPEAAIELRRDDGTLASTPRAGGSGAKRREAKLPTVASEDVAADDEGDGFNYTLMERAIEASLRGLAERGSSDPSRQQDRVAVDHEREAIEVISRQFLGDQATMLRSARRECKRLAPQLRDQIAAVSKELQRKLRENPGDRKPSRAATRLSMRAGSEPPASDRADQARHAATVSKLKKELALLTRQLSQIRIEQHFPRCMMWKLKVDAGDGTFIGIRDLEIGQIKADYHACTVPNKPGHIRLEVNNIVANLGILELAIRGANTKARVLGGLLTPTITRLDIDVRGSWVLELKFSQGGAARSRLHRNQSGGAQARWEEVKDKSSFHLTLSRKVTGFTTIRLPQSFLQTLSKLLIPKLISGALKSLLPLQIGLLLREHDNAISVQGSVDVTGDMSPQTWREPLVAPTAAAARARQSLGVSHAEAVMLDFLCRGPRAAAAGFKNKAISLARLFKWRLKYATYRVTEMEEMLDLIQRDASAELPSGWLSQLIRFVTVLAKKPLDVRLSVASIETDINLSRVVDAGLDMYISSFRQALAAARAKKARAAAKQRLEEAQLRVGAISRLMRNFVVPIVDPSIEVNLTGLFVGGLHAGLVVCTLRKVLANLRMPAHFLFRPVIPRNLEEYPLDIEGSLGPRDDEYTVRVRMDALDGEASLALRNVHLDLFSTGAEPGAVAFEATEVRASMLLNMLDQILYEASQRIEADAADAADSAHQDNESSSAYVLKGTADLVDRVEAVLSISRAFEANEDEDAGREEDATRAGFLPAFVLSDSNDLRCDVRDINAVLVKERTGRGDAAGDVLRLQLRAQRSEAVRLSIRADMRDMFDLYQ